MKALGRHEGESTKQKLRVAHQDSFSSKYPGPSELERPEDRRMPAATLFRMYLLAFLVLISLIPCFPVKDELMPFAVAYGNAGGFWLVLVLVHLCAAAVCGLVATLLHLRIRRRKAGV
jgi:hypothetical protein